MNIDSANPATWLVPITHLKQCKLWEGSMLQISFKYSGVRRAEIEQAIATLEKADDRTPAENEWLAALVKTRAEW